MSSPRQQDCHHHAASARWSVVARPYHYPQVVKDELERQCREMLQQGIIHASSSAFSSSVLLVKKHDGSWRFCIDYHTLNSKMMHNMYLIPVVDELFDLHSGYHQVRIHDVDVAKTAFRTHHGQFEFLVMPFGLTNAPETFQALVHDILHDFHRQFVLVFFDDILIYSDSWSSHL
jgi:hypothetical protein